MNIKLWIVIVFTPAIICGFIYDNYLEQPATNRRITKIIDESETNCIEWEMRMDHNNDKVITNKGISDIIDNCKIIDKKQRVKDEAKVSLLKQAKLFKIE